VPSLAAWLLAGDNKVTKKFNFALFCRCLHFVALSFLVLYQVRISKIGFDPMFWSLSAAESLVDTLDTLWTHTNPPQRPPKKRKGRGGKQKTGVRCRPPSVVAVGVNLVDRVRAKQGEVKSARHGSAQIRAHPLCYAGFIHKTSR
jgi:hypothetical protein